MSGIVHLGPGAFARAFVFPFVETAEAASGGDWGIVGVSLQSPRTRNALEAQGWAYTALAVSDADATARNVAVLDHVLVAPEDPGAVLDAMSDPAVKIVTLTVTEKGYCHDPGTGRLNADDPDIIHDTVATRPRTAPGYLVRALARRRDAGLPPFTVLSCDNLPANGQLTRDVVLDLSRRIDPALAEWIGNHGRFPSSMVDRITPATTDADLDRVERLTGRRDRAAVVHEPFAQWVIEDDFVGGARPDWAAAGVEMVADVAPYEAMKLRMLNGTHSALAYTGYLAGYDTIADTVADPDFAAYARVLWSEIAPSLTPPPGVSLADYAETLLARYSNPAIRHRTWQIAMDGSQKLPQRLLDTIDANLAAGRGADGLMLAVAAWMRFAGGVDEAGRPIDVRDPLAPRLAAAVRDADRPRDAVDNVLAIRAVFAADRADRIRAGLHDAADTLWSRGARGAVADLVRGRD